MTAAVLSGVGLAVIASCALNGSFFLQHVGGRQAPAVDPRRPLATLRGLLSSRLWLIGMLGGLAGWALHITALSLAPLSLVQAFASGGLAITVPIAARLMRSPLLRTELLAVLAMAAALAALGIGTAAPKVAAVAPLPMAAFLFVCGIVATLLAVLGRGANRALALGIAGGVLYGAGDAATRALVGSGHTSLGGVLLSPWLAVVALASIGAFFSFQRGLQLGRAVAVIALMTATTNLVAIAAGLIAFGEPLGATPVTAALHLVALLVVIAATWLLARAQGRLSECAEQPSGSGCGRQHQPEMAA